MSPLSVFISYSSKEKVLAGRFKRNIERICGFEVFLAHDDIEPASEWEPEIVEAIRSSDYFIPLISEAFVNSPYTDQEVGIAIALRKKIIPIKLERVNPYGFISKYHAFQYRISKVWNRETDNTENLAIQIGLLANHYRDDELIEKAKDSIVHALEMSNSFDTSNTVIQIMCKIDGFSVDHLKHIMKAIEVNDQVQSAFGLKRLKKYLSENGLEIE